MEFSDWMREQLERNGISQAELSKRSGLSEAHISKLISNYKPGIDACIGLAKGFKLPPETVFRAAGILPPKPENEIEFDEWKYIITQLPETDRDELLQIARLKMERIEKDQMLADLRKQYEQIDPNDKQELFELIDKFLAEHGYKKR